LVTGCNLLSTSFKLSDTCKNAGYGILENDDDFFVKSTSNTTLDNLLEKSK
jgi:hypothetical protein